MNRNDRPRESRNAVNLWKSGQSRFQSAVAPLVKAVWLLAVLAVTNVNVATERLQMFEEFEERYTVTAVEEDQATVSGIGLESIEEFFSRYAGRTFDRGLYRAYNQIGAATAKSWIDASFPDYRSQVVPFGFDWLGRIWTTSIGPTEKDAHVYLFDPADDAFRVPSTFAALHDGEFVEFADDALLVWLFEEWSAGGELGYTDCAGYKVSPILGGEVVAANLETTDMDVNWHLSRQIREQIAGIDPGSPTGPFTIGD